MTPLPNTTAKEMKNNFHWANGTTNTVLVSLSTGLSFLGCLVILITYILYKDIRTSSRHIIVCLTISDLVAILSNWSGLLNDSSHTNNICVAQSFLGTTAILCSFLWTMMLAIFLYVTLVHERRSLAERFICPWFHILCWGVPLLINIEALRLKKLGNSKDASTAGWCWIKIGENHNDAVLWMFLDGKGIELLTYVVVLVLYVKIKLSLRKKIKEFARLKGSASYLTFHTVEAAKNADRKLIFIPVMLIVLRMWGTIRFFMYIARGNTSKDKEESTCVDIALILLHAFCDNFQGAANCVLFCLLTPKVRNHLKESLAYCLQSGCIRDEIEYEEYFSESRSLVEPS